MMNMHWFFLALAGFALTACNEGSNKNNLPANDKNQTGVVAPDNTKINVRDRHGDTITPFDQNENSYDRNITQEIRKRIMDDDALSTNAKNLKVMTIDGVVTLRGPVDNPQEKDAVIKKITTVGGVKGINNEIDVIPNNVR